jgi:hypothetical protein
LATAKKKYLQMEGKKYFDKVTWHPFFCCLLLLLFYTYCMRRSEKKMAEIFDERAQQHKEGNSSTNPSILHLNSLYETWCFLLSTHRVALS